MGGSSMLELSDIQPSQEELQDYYAQLGAQHVTPAWIGGGISTEPRSEAVPHLWRWRDLRPQAMRAAELVGTQQAERRVLRLTNPKLPGAASNTLVANIQIVMPGEIARAHRHSAAALRLIIEGRGGYTVVNGERVPMYPGDLVLTPNWSWHDHANDTDAPMIWLDGLDTPLVGGRRLDWEDKDVFTVPTWTFCEHVNSGDRPAFLFSFSDAPVMRALSLYREETRS